ncbi:trans-acting enoyl reductase family protein [Streptomyces sp. WMMB 322]|uniref:saccharopine dehydrogenase family protein n=1 Tax=Streptomyces sp. WMMB 322 TaxID=1286821 RepID=UPI0006E1FC87|nr:saccharopine dehydrogenase NADP-binding domain-containing protein [Streptomyces sp. WMMB 322]SCK06177.1 Uncharacterized conserved protein [Streptomyces sp. WMMB 322]
MTALIYGVTGYMGRLTAARAAEAGLRPVLAGRDPDRTAAIGRELGLPTRAFALDDPSAVRRGLADVTVVLNGAGPFGRTSRPLIEACIETGTHYLDFAGEVPEFEIAAGLGERARQAGVMLLPGAGFGVVPTDSLAVHLHRRLSGADRLEIAFQTVGGLSRGTASTLLRDLPRTGVRRQGGSYVRHRAAAVTKKADFGAGPVTVASNPWRADLLTAAHSTGIPTIDTYTALPAPVRVLMRLAARLPRLFGSRAWYRLLDPLVRRLPAGPDEEELAKGSSHIWGRATAPDGRRVTATMHGPEAYEFTARTARLLLQRVLAGEFTPGFQTPASVYGPDLVLEIDGVRRTDVM